MKRLIFQNLIEWKNKASRMPLLVRGTRQTGKTYIIQAFGKQCFEHILTINFELDTKYKHCFKTLDAKQIVKEIELLSNQSLVAGKSLLFLDEIQECPEAIRALRYFFEMLPGLHVIGAGSLLEFSLDAAQFSMPVGRVEFLHCYPMTFSEMLMALEEDKLLDYISNITLKDKIPTALHERLLELLELYFVIGGMPQALNVYVKEQSLLSCRNIQTALLNSYRADFGKYATRIQQQYCERVFEKIPSLVGQHFKYTDIDPDMDGRLIKIAIQLFFKAKILSPIYYSKSSSLPLSATQVEKRYKVLFLDLGLIQAALRISPEVLLNENFIQNNSGALAEQFIGQHLLTLQSPNDQDNLYYWQRDTRGSQAEVDYVIAVEDKIIPVEVKSGKQGRLKSMHLFLEAHHTSFGIKLSREALNVDLPIWTVPLYLIEQLPRLVRMK